ncbi:MAG TPA: HAD family hydrolase, partial [Pyrinomonadaceae bacterium]
MPPPVPGIKLSAVHAVFFDFGETLVVLSPTKEELFVRAAQSCGLKLSVDMVRRGYQTVDFHNKYSSVHTKDRESFYHHYNQQLCEALGISSHFAQLAPALATHFKLNKRWKLIEDVPDVLQRLSGHGLPLALVANWGSDLESLTEELGIRQYFAAIIPSQVAGVEKPDPAIFHLALDRLSLSASTQTVLYVGNEYRADVMGARAAGLTPV